MAKARRKVNSAKIAPTVMRLTAAGYSRAKISRQLGCSEATVSRIRREHKDDGLGTLILEVPMPKARSQIAAEVLECLERTPEGFERFYNRYNTEYRLPAHWRRFVEMALPEDQCVINVPPGHGKSSVFSIWLPIWMVAMDRDIQILLLSKAQDLAVEFCRSIAFEMESNDKMISELGRFKPVQESGSWSPGVGKLSVEGRNRSKSHGGTLLARGAGQQVYGFRADHIIADDLEDVETVMTPERRAKTREWYHTIVHSRRRVEGRTWVVGTRFHPEDISGELIEQRVTDDPDAKPLYRHINFPALADPDTGLPTNDFENGVALWPEEWPPEKLKAKVYEHVGASRWQQTYQQVPITSEDALARPEWIEGTTPKEERSGCLDLTRVVGQSVKGEKVRVISIDPSPTKFWAFIVADVLPPDDKGNREVVILEIVREKMLQRQAMEVLDRMVEEHGNVRYVIFEINSFARWATQDVDFDAWAKSHSIRVIGHTTHRNKTDPEMGLQSLGKEFEFGRIRLPYADVYAKQMSQLLIREATQYTPAYKGTTDVLMALWFIHFNRKKLKGPNAVSQMVNGWRAPKRVARTFLRQKAGSAA